MHYCYHSLKKEKKEEEEEWKREIRLLNFFLLNGEGCIPDFPLCGDDNDGVSEHDAFGV